MRIECKSRSNSAQNSMPVVIALISQKGGVGKSTLARGLAAVIARAGLQVRVADLDAQQLTVVHWERTRRANRISPSLDVRSYPTAEAAFGDTDGVQVLIIDTPGHVSPSTLTIAANAHLVVQPAGASLDDLHPGVQLYNRLVEDGISSRRLMFALCRTQADDEEEGARFYIQKSGYSVLPGTLPESTDYRRAQNNGCAINETPVQNLNQGAAALMLAVLSRLRQ